MNKEEIKQALEIIRQPITVNCKDYYYFDQENYNNLLHIYENCQWFINNFEQLMVNIKDLKEKVNQLKTNRGELKKWLEENRNRYIYQDGLGEDWYFEDLDVFDELKEIIERGKE